MGDAVSCAAGGIEEVKGRRREAGGRSTGRLRRKRDYDRIGSGAMIRLLVIISCLFFPGSALACKCVLVRPLCAELPSLKDPGGAIFIGKVTEVYPRGDLERYYRTMLPGRKLGDVESNPPSLKELKEGQLRLWRGIMNAAEVRRLLEASTVEEFSPLLDGVGWPFVRRVRLEVWERFSGPESRNFELFTGLGGGDCGVEFKEGEEWLVYASQDQKSGRWGAGICGHSSLLKDSANEVAVMRALKEGRRPAPHISGRLVGETRRGRARSTTSAPLTGVKVTLLNEDGKRLETKTDKKGNFRFENLEKMRYTLDVPLPGWSFGLNPKVSPVFDLMAEPCAEYHGWMREDRRPAP